MRVLGRAAFRQKESLCLLPGGEVATVPVLELVLIRLWGRCGSRLRILPTGAGITTGRARQRLASDAVAVAVKAMRVPGQGYRI